MPPNASTLVTVGIPFIALISLALVGVLVQRSNAASATRAFAIGALLWLAYSGALALSGVLARFDVRPAPLVLVVAPTFLLPIALALSRVGKNVAMLAPVALLVGFQAFRLPLELVMHEAAVEGTMPVQMSFGGMNFDIATGITALIVGALAAFDRAPRWLLIGWNALGSLLLATIVVIALASLPIVHAFGTAPEQLNTWVAYFPFVWLPAGPVCAALFGHVVLWRRLLATASARHELPQRIDQLLG